MGSIFPIKEITLKTHFLAIHQILTKNTRKTIDKTYLLDNLLLVLGKLNIWGYVNEIIDDIYRKQVVARKNRNTFRLSHKV